MKILKIQWKNEINQMAFPILMNYLVSISFETIDKALISNYSVEGFAAIGISGGFLYNITGALGILSAAYGILAGRAKGKKEDGLYRKLFRVSLGLSILIGMAFLLIALTTGKRFLSAVYGLDGKLLSDATVYYQISSCTVLLNMMGFQFNAFLRTEKNTRIALAANLISAGINLILDECLIYGKFGFRSYGVAGAAMASVIGLSVSVVVLYIGYRKTTLKASKGFVQSSTKGIRIVKDMMKLYLPLLLQDFVEYTLFSTILMAMVSRLEINEIAAYHIIYSITSYLILPAYAYGTVAMTLSIQIREAGNEEKAETVIHKSFVYMSIIMTILISLTLVGQHQLIYLFTKDSKVLACAVRYLWISVLFQLLHGRMQIYKYVLQGYGQEKYVFYQNLCWCVISCVISMDLFPVLGLAAIYLGIIISYIGNWLKLRGKYQQIKMRVWH